MYKQMLSMILSVSLMFSTLFVSSAEGWVTIVDGAEFSGMGSGLTEREIAASTDGSDAGGSSGEGEDSEDSQPKQKQEIPFLVKTGKGVSFGEYEDWNALLAAFKEKGSFTEEYTVTVAEEAVIGTPLPSQAGLLKLEPEREYGILLFGGKTVNMTCALSIGKAALCVADGGSRQDYAGTDSGYDENFAGTSININTKGKALTLNGTRNAGIVRGNPSAVLDVIGNAEVRGNLQSFKSVTVQGSLKLENNVTGIKNLNIEKGTIYLASGRKFMVTNVTAGEGGTLIYPEEAKIPVVKFSGIVQGSVQIRQMARKKGVIAEQFFVEGSKLLTASKAGAEQFLLSGEKQACYKKNSAVYAGTEAMHLYCGNTFLGTHAQWKDLVAQIKNRNEASASYRVVLLRDQNIAGVLAMPPKGKYAGMSLESPDPEKNVLLKSTGGATLTANLTVGSGVCLQTRTISGALWKLTLAENAQAVSVGTVLVGNLAMQGGASLQAGGKLTVKNLLTAKDGTELILTLKKGAAIRDTKTGDIPVTVKIRDMRNNRVTLAKDAILFKVTGDSRADQYILLDAEEREYTLYREGNALRVKGRRIIPGTEGEWSGDYL